MCNVMVNRHSKVQYFKIHVFGFKYTLVIVIYGFFGFGFEFEIRSSLTYIGPYLYKV